MTKNTEKPKFNLKKRASAEGKWGVKNKGISWGEDEGAGAVRYVALIATSEGTPLEKERLCNEKGTPKILGAGAQGGVSRPPKQTRGFEKSGSRLKNAANL